MQFEIFSKRTLRGKRWFFRLRASNHEILCQSEGYVNRIDCIETMRNVRDNAHLATMESK